LCSYVIVEVLDVNADLLPALKGRLSVVNLPTLDPRVSGAVSAFIIICSIRVHWFLRPLNAMRYADAYKPQRYISVGDPGFPRPVGL
jgi:hypothetical protein